MVLVLLADAGEVADDRDVELVEELGVANTRALENLCPHIVSSWKVHICGLMLT